MWCRENMAGLSLVCASTRLSPIIDSKYRITLIESEFYVMITRKHEGTRDWVATSACLLNLYHHGFSETNPIFWPQRWLFIRDIPRLRRDRLGRSIYAHPCLHQVEGYGAFEAQALDMDYDRWYSSRLERTSRCGGLFIQGTTAEHLLTHSVRVYDPYDIYNSPMHEPHSRRLF